MKLLSEIIKKNLSIIEEEKIVSLRQKITVDYDVFKTTHAIVRQTRHGKENSIDDYDIISLINDSLPIISRNIINHRIRDNKEFIVSREGGDNLNLVLIPQNKGEHWNLIVKTLMRKQNFLGRNNQVKLIIPKRN